MLLWFDLDFTEFCLEGPELRNTSIGSLASLAWNRREAIIFNNEGLT